jgi:hypothetical protein
MSEWLGYFIPTTRAGERYRASKLQNLHFCPFFGRIFHARNPP